MNYNQSPSKQSRPRFGYLPLVLLLVVVGWLVVDRLALVATAADTTTQRFQDQLESINQNIQEVNADLDGIQIQQSTLADTIRAINQGIGHLDQEIGQSRQRLVTTRQLIGRYEREAGAQKGILRHLLRTLQRQTDISDLELLLTAENFSDYLDRQEYLSRLKTEVSQSVSQLLAAQATLEVEQQNEQISLTNLVGQQETQASLKAEQEAILKATRGEEARFQARLQLLEAEYEGKQRELEAYLASLLRRQVVIGEATAGDIIGKMGNTGWSTAPHLHLAIYADSSTKYDPLRYITSNDLTWPVGGSGGYVSQGFNPRHQALDVAGPAGLPIRAIADGKIIHRGCLWPGTRWSTFGVILNHNQGRYYSLYIHLQAPDNEKYNDCSLNRRPPEFGGRYYLQKSIDYDVTF